MISSKQDMAGKVAIVTGSSRGIGFAIAKKFLDLSMKVVVNARNAEPLKAFFSEYGDQVLIVPGDVSIAKDAKVIVSSCIRKFSSLDYLICNVGGNIGKEVTPGEDSEEDFIKGFQKNFFSAVTLINEAKSSLEKTRGSIVCVSSICGHEVLGAPTYYNCSKAALNMYVKSNSRIFAKSGIRINAIAPGNIMFQGSVWEQKVRNTPEQVKSLIEREVPQNRFGTPEDIAASVAFLCSPNADFINGEILTIDGGQTRSV